MRTLEAMDTDLSTVLGRVSALYAGLIAVIHALPPQAAAQAQAEMLRSAEVVHADALAMPISEALLNEQKRVMDELATIFGARAQI